MGYWLEPGGEIALGVIGASVKDFSFFGFSLDYLSPASVLGAFYLKRKRIIDMVIKKVDLHMVDMGIAMSHFELTLNENGIKGFWKKETNHCKQENLEYIASWVMNNDKIFQN